MKKVLALALISAMLMAFAGCTGGEQYMVEGTVTEIGDGNVTVSATDGNSYLVKISNSTVCKINGENADYTDIKVGASVTVAYNGMTTRSIPAQITAQKITVSDSADSGASVTMTATVMAVESGMLRVEVLESEYTFGEHVVHVSDETQILAADGRVIALSDISVGSTVDITYSGQVMLSLPPQIVAKKIQVRH